MARTADMQWRPASRQVGAPASRPVRMLVAHGGATEREVFRQLLDMEGDEVTFVEDGARAVDLTLRCEFDLVLLDLRLPVLDGFTALQVIRNTEGRVGKRRTPILIVGGCTSIEDPPNFMEAGADGCIEEPVRTTELLRAVVRFCLL